MTRYVIAADGGNSKTDLVLATTDGEVLASVQAAGTRPHVDGMPQMAKDLAALCARALDAAGLDSATPVAVGAFYLANIDFDDDERAAQDALRELGVAEKVTVANDVFAILRTGSDRGWGVAVVSGAGINAIGVGPDGQIARFLSLGETTGDWGGGYSVGLAGLGAAVRADDGRGAPTELARLVAAHFGEPDAASVAIGMHRGRIDPELIYTLSPVVFDAAAHGDRVAHDIVERLADEVATMAGTLLRRLELLESDADVVLGGGTLRTTNGLLVAGIETRLHAVAPRVHIRAIDAPPMAGALVEALALAGASVDAQRRARSAAISGQR